MKYLLLLLLTASAQAEFTTQKYWNYIFVDKGSYCSKLCEDYTQQLAQEAVEDNITRTHQLTHPINVDEELQQVRDFKNKCNKQCKLPKKRRGLQKRPKGDK